MDEPLFNLPAAAETPVCKGAALRHIPFVGFLSLACWEVPHGWSSRHLANPLPREGCIQVRPCQGLSPSPIVLWERRARACCGPWGLTGILQQLPLPSDM